MMKIWRAYIMLRSIQVPTVLASVLATLVVLAVYHAVTR